MHFKTSKRSFGFLYKFEFIQGTVIIDENNQLNAYIIDGDREYESIDAWKSDKEERDAFCKALSEFLK